MLLEIVYLSFVNKLRLDRKTDAQQLLGSLVRVL